jgi:WD40 repeat protein
MAVPDFSRAQSIPGIPLKQRYHILSQIGTGGFGAVYRAEDTQLGNRLVAVKAMGQRGLNAQERARAAAAFKREALMLASLMHPNLPRIYEHFSEAGHWYLVMDFIEGQTVESYLSRTRHGYLPIEEVLDIGIQLCTVLDYLHTSRPPIVFRDLKPSNAMVTGNGHLYLIDFGIARHFKLGQSKDTIAFGSPGYAAPEQYGRTQTTPRSDIYSLGATLHQLLTGNDPSVTPFRFAPLQASGHFLLVPLARLITQMVEIDEDKRPPSMAIVKQELQRITAGLASGERPLAIPPPPTQLRIRRTAPGGTVLRTYHGHTDRVRTIAWSPDGSRIASAGKDRTVQIWNVTAGESLLTYRGHSQTVRAIAWSPDGSRLVSASEDRTVQVWDATTGETIFTYGGHTSGVYAVAWSPDSICIASTGIDKTVQVWMATTGLTLLTYHGHSGIVYTVAWSPDGEHIASGSYDATVQVWNPLNAQRVCIYSGHAALVHAVAWSADAKYIASGGGNDVHVWAALHGHRVCRHLDHIGLVYALAWSPGGTCMASGSLDATVRLWDATSGKSIYTYTGHSSEVNAVAWSPDGSRIASAGNDMTIQVWLAE